MLLFPDGGNGTAQLITLYYKLDSVKMRDIEQSLLLYKFSIASTTINSWEPRLDQVVYSSI